MVPTIPTHRKLAADTLPFALLFRNKDKATSDQRPGPSQALCSPASSAALHSVRAIRSVGLG